MAKYTPMDLLKSLHGKVCGHSDVYFAQRGTTLYTSKICAPRTTPPNENELAVRSKFTTVRKAVLALSSQEQAAYAAVYKKNPQGYSTLQGYIQGLVCRIIQCQHHAPIMSPIGYIQMDISCLSGQVRLCPNTFYLA